MKGKSSATLKQKLRFIKKAVDSCIYFLLPDKPLDLAGRKTISSYLEDIQNGLIDIKGIMAGEDGIVGAIEQFLNEEEATDKRYTRAKESLFNPDVEILFSEKDLLAAFAYCAIQASPFVCPEQLQGAIGELQDYAGPFFKQRNGYMCLTILKLEDFILSMLRHIPQVKTWAVKNDDSTLIIAEGDNSHPGFISTEPLCRNIAHHIYIQHCFYSDRSYLPK